MTSAWHRANIVIPVALTGLFFCLMRWYLGIDLGDDSIYMHDGISMGPSYFLLMHDWAPLYSFWFKVLVFVFKDTVVCYFASWTLIVSCIALVPTLFRRPEAWLYTLIILPLPYMVASKFVGLFASAILITSLCWLLGKRLSFAETLCADCILMFGLTFCRPEYNAGVLICTVATIVAVIFEQIIVGTKAKADSPIPASSRSPWLLCNITVALSLLIRYILRHQTPSHRSGMAFAQHFNVRSALKGLIPLGPDSWRSNYAELRFGVDIKNNALTGTATISQFIHANPRLFIGHLIDNFLDRKGFLLVAFTLAVVALPWFLKGREALRPTSLFILFFSLPPLAGSIVIFPNPHYAAVIVPSLILFALLALNLERWLRPYSLLLFGACVACLLFVYANPHNSTSESIAFDRLSLYRLQCVRPWDARVSKTNTNAFSVSEITPVFVEPSRTMTFPYAFADWSTLQNWMTNTRPAWISIDDNSADVYGTPTIAHRYGVPREQIDGFLRNDLGYTPHACKASAQLTVYTLDRP